MRLDPTRGEESKGERGREVSDALDPETLFSNEDPIGTHVYASGERSRWFRMTNGMAEVGRSKTSQIVESTGKMESREKDVLLTDESREEAEHEQVKKRVRRDNLPPLISLLEGVAVERKGRAGSSAF